MSGSVRDLTALGHDVLLVTDHEDELARSSSSDVLVTDLSEVTTPAIAAWLGGRHVDGVLSLGADTPVLVSSAARSFGLPGVPEEVARRCTRKDLRIAALAKHGLPVPAFSVVKSLGSAREALDKIGCPVVVKPLDRTGSVGVAEVGHPKELPLVFEEALQASSRPGVILEQKLIGTEHTVGGFMINGDLLVTGFSDRDYSRKTEFYPHYFESGDTFPSRLDLPQRERVVSHLEAAARAVGIDNSVINSDILCTADGTVYVLEVTCRLAGSRIATEVLPLGTGVDPLPQVVSLALGGGVDLDALRPRRERPVVQRFLPCHGGRVESVKPISVDDLPEGVYDVRYLRALEPGQTLPDYRDADDVIAGAIAWGNSIDEAERRTLDALANLPLVVTDEK